MQSYNLISGKIIIFAQQVKFVIYFMQCFKQGIFKLFGTRATLGTIVTVYYVQNFHRNIDVGTRGGF